MIIEIIEMGGVGECLGSTKCETFLPMCLYEGCDL